MPAIAKQKHSQQAIRAKLKDVTQNRHELRCIYSFGAVKVAVFRGPNCSAYSVILNPKTGEPMDANRTYGGWFNPDLAEDLLAAFGQKVETSCQRFMPQDARAQDAAIHDAIVEWVSLHLRKSPAPMKLVREHLHYWHKSTLDRCIRRLARPPKPCVELIPGDTPESDASAIVVDGKPYSFVRWFRF